MPSRNSWVDDEGQLHRGDWTVFPGAVELVAVPELAYDYSVLVSVVAVPTPRAVVTEVTIRSRDGGRQVTARAVAAELGPVRRAAVHLNSVVVGAAPDGKVPSWEELERAGNEAVRSAMSEGRKQVTQAELKLAAKAYRDAEAAGLPTTRAVARALKLSEDTKGQGVARQRVNAARKAGLLAKSAHPRASVT